MQQVELNADYHQSNEKILCKNLQTQENTKPMFKQSGQYPLHPLIMPYYNRLILRCSGGNESKPYKFCHEVCEK